MGCVRAYSAEHACGDSLPTDVLTMARISASAGDTALMTRADANNADTESLDEGGLLQELTSRPAPHMFHHVPTQLEVRFGELLRDRLSVHADAELDAAKHPGAAAEEKAMLESQRLWTLTPAILAVPSRQQQTIGSAEPHNDNFETVEIIRKRLQKAETGQWKSLYADLLEILREDTRDLQSDFVHAA
eukprot:615799-Karenia_brevis.AAC.1